MYLNSIEINRTYNSSNNHGPGEKKRTLSWQRVIYESAYTNQQINNKNRKSTQVRPVETDKYTLILSPHKFYTTRH